MTTTRPVRSGRSHAAAELLGFGLGYAALQELGLQLVAPSVGVAAFWPSAGFAVGVLSWVSPRRWPAFLVVLAAVEIAGRLLGGTPLALASGFAVADLLGAALGAGLLRHGARSSAPARLPESVADPTAIRLILPATLIAPAVGGLVGAAAQTAAGGDVAQLPASWWTWFAADALGILAVLPALQAWRSRSRTRRQLRPAELAERLALVAVQVVLLAAVLDPLGAVADGSLWPFLLLLSVLWSTSRLGQGFSAMLSTGTTAVAVWATVHGHGPFATGQIAGIQVFCGTLLLTSLVLSSVLHTRQVAEAEVRRRSTALENAVEGIAFLDPSGRYLEVNRAYARFLGTVPEAVLGRGWQPTVHGDDLSLVEAAYEEMLATGKGETMVRGVRVDGSVFRKEVTLVAQLAADGRLAGNYCLMRDVTEREAAREHLDRLFECSPELLCVADTAGHLLRVNPAWSEVLGYPAGDLVGWRYLDFVHPDDRAATAALSSELAGVANGLLDSAGDDRGFENRYRCQDGSYRWLSWRWSLDVERRLVYGVARDVTTAKETATRLAEARDQALETSRLKSQFLATMSHEIRTPLNGVLGLGGLLAETELDGTQRRYVDGIATAGTTLLSVINDVLDFSKIEAGRFVLDEVDFDLRAIVEDVLALNLETSARKDIDLVTELDDELPPVVRGDPTRVRQVLLNLVGNATKFTESGSVTVRARQQDPGTGSGTGDGAGSQHGPVVQLEVVDTGPGMPADVVDRLFEPFTQADASTTRLHGGTGLGLAICRQLVEAMQGSIEVESRPGAGSTFRVVLPLSHAVDDARPVDRAERDRLAVLIVDDDDTNRLVLHAQVSSWGMHGHAVGSEAEAIQRLRTATLRDQPYDVAIVDMCLPSMTGLELADAIAANPEIASLPVVLLTSGEALSPAEVRKAGIAASLTKPVTRATLYDALVHTTASDGSRQAAAASAPSGARVLLVEDNEINQTVAVGILERLGYEVDVASDGVEAIEQTEDRDYHAILMDCQMPRMDGIEATRRLRQRERTATVPVIAMTANAFKEDRERCLAAGMNDYLAKPIRAHDLDAVVTRWTSPTPPLVTETASEQEPAQGDATGSSVGVRLRELADPGDPEDVALVRFLCESFERRAPVMLANLRGALAQADWPEVAERAHSLKGAAANLGAVGLAAACQVVEDLARDEQGEVAERHVERLRTELDTAVGEVRAYAAALA